MVQVPEINFVQIVLAFCFCIFVTIGVMILKRLGKDDLALWFGVSGAVMFALFVVGQIFSVTDYVVETSKRLTTGY